LESPKKKILFIVQGDGRGHMTQSIAMREIIQQAGMDVCAVLIGKSERRQIPGFYYDRINTPVTAFDSPNFVTDSKMKAILILPSIAKNLLLLKTFLRSLKIIDEKIKEHKPDLIVNFYDPMIGLYYMFYKPKIPMVCVAHQYFYHHPGFEFPKGRNIEKICLKLFNNLTAFGSEKKLALSFYPFRDSQKNAIYVIPPLLRETVSRQSSVQGNYILVYLVNCGYLQDISDWHAKNGDVELHCFSDRETPLELEQIRENLFFHKLNDQKFLEMMSNARGLVSTAGFETVCEAMYLGKPVFMVPVEGHYEQFCNSRDAFKAGAGLYDKRFRITRFLNYLASYRDPTRNFRDWAGLSPKKTMEQLRSML
jgi:uncharacterized protein (TIGR00661 family)